MKPHQRTTIQELIKKKVLNSDDFIEKLRAGNAGMLLIGNIWCFDYAISHLPSDSPIVEIGSFSGLSTNLIIYLKSKYKQENKVICSDPWDFNAGHPEEKIADHPYLTCQDYSNYIKENFIRNVLFFSKHDLPYAIESNSDTFFKYWEKGEVVQDIFERSIKLGESISFAYIDGNHSYDYAARDFENVDRYLEIDGFILFDDSSDKSDSEVCKLMEEIIESNRYEVIKKAPNYLVKKLSHKK
ncbi:class I SAM-dependent methyltransferase [Crocosphaera sp.]|uniref:class I SAM-dependent methyltransferase n=1 Tax=Crocosphaera sp. TaxID=2729996 RepID=UPI00262EAA14|nr:class I SAM-dependent methyltransferase [Crocosphaera sp.]MDJ0581304.1 class I SAM-dependent methyltransferase [Crocosphaera sp.]